MFYFKYPKLGSYACFPLKVKSCLSERAFDEGVNAYKEYVKSKGEVDKEHQEKVAEARAESEEARKKYEDL